jgi:hypothetical protein
MSVFCFLWIPLFYLFWSSISPGNNAGAGGVWALLLGGIVALAQFFLGSLVNPGGFGLSRWVSACIDIVGLPAVLPFIICAVFMVLRVFSGTDDFTGFALLWLIPGAFIRAVSSDTRYEPSLLVLVPLLWTAVAVGIPFFIRIVQSTYGFIALLAVIPMGLLPFLAATVYWAFFAQKQLLGFVLLALSVVPALLSIITSFYRTAR